MVSTILKEINRPIKQLRSQIREKLNPTVIKDRYVKVEFSASCNSRCDYCWMFYKTVDKPQGFMKLENFKKFVEMNKEYFNRNHIRIMTFFNGESLLHPQVWEMFDVMVENQIMFMDLDTNLAVNKDVTPLMKYPFRKIRVNIGGITKEVHESVMHNPWENLTRNLRSITAIDPSRVIVKMNVTRKNRPQVPDVPQWTEEMGGLKENVLVTGMNCTLPTLYKKEELDFYFKNVVDESMDPWLGFTYDPTKEDYDIQSKKRECQYHITAVNYDGRLTICCHDQTGLVNLGNAFEKPIIELLLADRYKKAKEMAKNMASNFARIAINPKSKPHFILFHTSTGLKCAPNNPTRRLSCLPQRKH